MTFHQQLCATVDGLQNLFHIQMCRLVSDFLCPPIQVLEPNWESMVAKIRSGRVTNVDHVLEIHSDFLSTCLNDCMLSSPQLLTTVKKLLRSVPTYSAFHLLVVDVLCVLIFTQSACMVPN